MSEPSKYPNFTAEDIGRYYAGKMSDRERNALERAALEDPFLADALEGYTQTSSAAADLEILQERLSAATSRKKTSIIFFRHNPFMRAAAIILLVIGAGWFITRLINKTEMELANSTNKNDALQSQADSVDKNAIPEESRVVLNDSAPLSGDLVDQETATSASADRKKLPAASRKLSTPVISREEPYITKMNAAAPPQVMKETQQVRDTNYTIAATDLYGVEFRGDSIKNLNIVMVESDQVLNEVVVLDKRKNRAMANAPAKTMEEIEPVGGWEGYNNYALSNLKPPPMIDQKPQTGDVVLSFDINTLGEPTNIEVVESHCISCEQEAKRILLEGPKWKNRNKKKAKIRIRF